MSDLANPTDAVDQDDYLRRIDDAIANSESLRQWLRWRSSLDGKRPSKSMLLLMQSLEQRVEAAHWLRQRSLAPLLPIVLRAASHPDDLAALEPWYRMLLRRPTGVTQFIRRFFYPIVVGGMALVLFYLFSIYIIPMFKGIFEEFELSLSSSTKNLFYCTDLVAHRPWLALGQLVLSIAWLVGILKLVHVLLDYFDGYRWVGWLRRGTASSLRSMAQWTGTLAELLSIGTPEPQAVATAGIASHRPRLELQSIRLSQARAAEPDTPWNQQRSAADFSPSAIAALDLIHQGTAPPSILRDLAQSYAVRWSSRRGNSYGWVGQIVIIVVATLVWIMASALFLPLLSLITSLSK